MPFGPDGWIFRSLDGESSIIVSASDLIEGEWKGVEFVHASIARPQMPTYEDLKMLHRACFSGYSYQVFPPEHKHINIHETTLHLWGGLDGKPLMPEFGKDGTI